MGTINIVAFNKRFNRSCIGTGRIGSIAASILQKDIEVMLLHMIHFLMKRLRNMLSIRIRWKKLYVMQILLQFIFQQRNIIHISSIEIYFQNLKRCRICKRCWGSIVDTRALLDAIDSGHIKGAALDTYEHERGLFPGDYRNKAINDDLLDELIARDIWLTPHIAFYTDAAVKNLIVDALDAVIDVMNTGTTKLRVN